MFYLGIAPFWNWNIFYQYSLARLLLLESHHFGIEIWRISFVAS